MLHHLLLSEEDEEERVSGCEDWSVRETACSPVCNQLLLELEVVVNLVERCSGGGKMSTAPVLGDGLDTRLVYSVL